MFELVLPIFSCIELDPHFTPSGRLVKQAYPARKMRVLRYLSILSGELQLSDPASCES